MNHFQYIDGVLHAENVAIPEIAKAVGTPFYVYSTATLDRHYKVFAKAFDGVDAMVCYAMKANSNQAVLKTLARLGAGDGHRLDPGAHLPGRGLGAPQHLVEAVAPVGPGRGRAAPREPAHPHHQHQHAGEHPAPSPTRHRFSPQPRRSPSDRRSLRFPSPGPLVPTILRGRDRPGRSQPRNLVICVGN